MVMAPTPRTYPETTREEKMPPTGLTRQYNANMGGMDGHLLYHPLTHSKIVY